MVIELYLEKKTQLNLKSTLMMIKLKKYFILHNQIYLVQLKIN